MQEDALLELAQGETAGIKCRSWCSRTQTHSRPSLQQLRFSLLHAKFAFRLTECDQLDSFGNTISKVHMNEINPSVNSAAHYGAIVRDQVSMTADYLRPRLCTDFHNNRLKHWQTFLLATYIDTSILPKTAGDTHQ